MTSNHLPFTSLISIIILTIFHAFPHSTLAIPPPTSDISPYIPPGVPPAPQCSKSGTCGPGQYCALYKGDTCCLARTCYPECPPTHVCEQTRWRCGELNCKCPPWLVCKPRKEPLSIAAPPDTCKPKCKEGEVCLRTSYEVASYKCRKGFPGCWEWTDCTVGAFGDLVAKKKTEEDKTG